MSSALDASLVFNRAIAEHLEVIASLREQETLLQRIAEEIRPCNSLAAQSALVGNGGIAADSQHQAAELMRRFRRERCGLASIALTTDTSVLTAVANDYEYETVFQRQVEPLSTKGEVVVGISTSVSSNKVCATLESGRRMGAFTVAFTGESGGTMAGIAHVTLRIRFEGHGPHPGGAYSLRAYDL